MATENQKRVMERVAEQVRKGAKVSVSKAMKGIYSDHTAKQPAKVTKTKGWQELLNTHLPQSRILEVHRELLEKKEVDFIKRGKKYVRVVQPHSDVKQAVDMGHKLHGAYAPERHEHNVKGTYSLAEEERQKLDKILAKNKK